MSKVFNDTTNFNGLVQIYEQECGFNQGDVSGNTALLKHFTADVNTTMDDFTARAIQAGGKAQYDDSNHTKYPIIKFNLITGQRDYRFVSDEQGNLVLDIYKVAILPSATSTLFTSLSPMDEFDGDNDIITENTATGTPSAYGKLGNGVFLDIPTSYDKANGMKVYINREASYFTYTDTTKKPGTPGIFHEYFALKPALKYAGRHGLKNYNDLYRRVIAIEGDKSKGITGLIDEYFAFREKDDRSFATNEPISFI